jgi:hypothetical protein
MKCGINGVKRGKRITGRNPGGWTGRSGKCTLFIFAIFWQKKAVPRRAILDFLGILYYVMIRAIEGKSIFRLKQVREYGIPLAETARDLGVCPFPIAKAIGKMDSKA